MGGGGVSKLGKMTVHIPQGQLLGERQELHFGLVKFGIPLRRNQRESHSDDSGVERRG